MCEQGKCGLENRSDLCRNMAVISVILTPITPHKLPVRCRFPFANDRLSY